MFWWIWVPDLRQVAADFASFVGVDANEAFDSSFHRQRAFNVRQFFDSHTFDEVDALHYLDILRYVRWQP